MGSRTSRLWTAFALRLFGGTYLLFSTLWAAFETSISGMSGRTWFMPKGAAMVLSVIVGNCMARTARFLPCLPAARLFSAYHADRNMPFAPQRMRDAVPPPSTRYHTYYHPCQPWRTRSAIRCGGRNRGIVAGWKPGKPRLTPRRVTPLHRIASMSGWTAAIFGTRDCVSRASRRLVAFSNCLCSSGHRI